MFPKTRLMLKHEVQNAFCIASNRHMDHILRTSMDWYNKRRGHSARDHLPPVRDSETELMRKDAIHSERKLVTIYIEAFPALVSLSFAPACEQVK